MAQSSSSLGQSREGEAYPIQAFNASVGTIDGEFPADLVDRIRRGVEVRGFYVFGRDDLGAVWGHTSGAPKREQILRRFAAAVGAELQPGWTPNVALVVRPDSVGSLR